MKRNSGFSLLELMLSLAITGLVLLILYSSFNLYFRVAKKAENKIEQDALTILEQLSGDIKSAYLSLEKYSSLNFIGTPTTLNFITTVGLKHNFSEPGSYDLQEVGYFLDSGSVEGRRSLIYRIDSTPDEDITKGGEVRKIASSVGSLKFRYYDGRIWQDTWHSQEELPHAVGISVTFEQRGGNPAVFSTIVEVSCARQPKKGNT